MRTLVLPIVLAALAAVPASAVRESRPDGQAATAAPPATQASPFALTVDSIMRGPALVGYPPSGLRWSGDSTTRTSNGGSRATTSPAPGRSAATSARRAGSPTRSAGSRRRSAGCGTKPAGASSPPTPVTSSSSTPSRAPGVGSPAPRAPRRTRAGHAGRPMSPSRATTTCSSFPSTPEPATSSSSSPTSARSGPNPASPTARRSSGKRNRGSSTTFDGRPSGARRARRGNGPARFRHSSSVSDSAWSTRCSRRPARTSSCSWPNGRRRRAWPTCPTT